MSRDTKAHAIQEKLDLAKRAKSPLRRRPKRPGTESRPVDIAERAYFRLPRKPSNDRTSWRSDAEMEQIKPFLFRNHGKSRVDQRWLLGGTPIIKRDGLRWSDARLTVSLRKTFTPYASDPRTRAFALKGRTRTVAIEPAHLEFLSTTQSAWQMGQSRDAKSDLPHPVRNEYQTAHTHFRQWLLRAALSERRKHLPVLPPCCFICEMPPGCVRPNLIYQLAQRCVERPRD